MGKAKLQTLKSALVAGLKEKSGRDDLRIASVSSSASKMIGMVPIEDRAGYPLRVGAVKPHNWTTDHGAWGLVLL